MKEVLCRCGNKAVLNKVTNEWELCSDCKRKLQGGNVALQSIGFGKKYINASLNDFKPNFCNTMLKDTNNFKNNLMLSGNSSVGKTHLMASIADKLLDTGVKSSSIVYVNMVDLCVRIGADITAINEIIDTCSKCAYLFLDEVIATKTPWEERMIYLILENRRNDELTTISATNCPLDKIEGRFVSRLLDNNGVNYNLTRNIWSVK